MAQIYLNEWTILKVDDELLLPSTSNSSNGTVWWSRWDNWLLTANSADGNYNEPIIGAIEPLINVNGLIQDPFASPVLYTLLAGEDVRTQVTLTSPPAGGANALVYATFRRSLFTSAFWESNLMGAAGEISNRLQYPQTLDYQKLDYCTSPWPIIVKQAARNALASVQVMLAGLGKTSLDGMVVDLSRSAQGLADTLNQLGDEIDRDIVPWRWSHSPGPRVVSVTRPLRGPFGLGINGLSYQYAWSVP